MSHTSEPVQCGFLQRAVDEKGVVISMLLVDIYFQVGVEHTANKGTREQSEQSKSA